MNPPEDTTIALVRLEGKIDQINTKMDERLDALRHAIEFGDRSALQTVQILAESVHRLETNQQDQGRRLRDYDSRVNGIENNVNNLTVLNDRMTGAETRIGTLERDRAKLIGFMAGVAFVGGGAGAAIAQLLGG